MNPEHRRSGTGTRVSGRKLIMMIWGEVFIIVHDCITVCLIDFENLKNNTYHFTAEFTCKRDQVEFRPDITLFINRISR